MGQHVQSAPQVGFGTTKLSGASIADTSLLAALKAVDAATFANGFPASCSGADIEVVTGTLYWENDGTAATADTRTLGAGAILSIVNSPTILANLHIMANATYDVRVSLNG